MKKTTTLAEALVSLKKKNCTNTHCADSACKGECEREYHYQVLKVVRRELDGLKEREMRLRSQKGVL